MAIINVLRSSKLFSGLSESELEKVASLSTEETHSAGSTIAREGERARKLYILKEGRVVLDIHIGHDPVRPATRATVRVVDRLESFGWSALVEPHVYTLSAECTEGCKLVAIDGERLRGLIDADHDLGFRVMKRLAAVIASRLRLTRHTLVTERVGR